MEYFANKVSDKYDNFPRNKRRLSGLMMSNGSGCALITIPANVEYINPTTQQQGNCNVTVKVFERKI